MLTPTQQLQSYYLALFGRAADPAGLTYWQEQLDSSALTPQGVLFFMLQSGEFVTEQNELFDSSNSAWINDIYQRLFAREADDEGISYWGQLAAEGATPQVLLEAIMAAASATDLEALDAYTSVAQFYSQNVSDADYDADQPLVQDGFRSNEQLNTDLQALDARFDTLSLTQAGESIEGRPLFAASVGDGPRKLMIVTQQHGDEPVGTEAAMHFLEWLSGDSDAAAAIREQVSVTVMPRVNPDGFARWEQLVAGNLDPETTLDPRRNAADIDLNRTWDSSQPLDATQAPETAAIRAVLAAFEPDMLLDYHNQNNYLNAAGELETQSVLWPTNGNVAPGIIATAQQAALALAQGLEAFDYGYLSLFPGGDAADIGRNGIGLDGTPVLLVEQRGLEEFELKALEGLELDFDAVASALTLEGILGMLGIARALGNDGFASLDPALALEIPERGERTPFEELYGEEIEWGLAATALDAPAMNEPVTPLALTGVADASMAEYQVA
ncbi:M14 family zinc carboxypeptidase [Halomonas sp. HMF6819]|uniref:M14 family zinc carboxypeptidase n=1 Tax=Halomonas sp. HMF6819 TaxID=3373085 RepID=UPI0037BA19F9